jgi:hypothetical protein
MAAAAPIRKPAQSTAPIPFIPGGYTAVPHSYFTRLFRCCTHVQMAIIGNVLDQTIGAEPNRKTNLRPDWTRITESQFAKLTGVTRDGVTKALSSIVYDAEHPNPRSKNLIEVRAAGRGREYRAMVENFAKAVERPQRELQRDAEEDIERPNRHQCLRPGSKPALITLHKPVKMVHCHNDSDAPVYLDHHIAESGALHFFIELKEGTGSAYSSMHIEGAGSAEKSSEVHTPVCISNKRRISDLSAFLTPVFNNLYHRPIDPAMLRQINKALKAPVESYKVVVTERLTRAGRRNERIASGLFLTMAGDCVAPKADTPAPPPEPVTVIHEPEDSGSLWMQIRLALKVRISEIAYQNWLLRTAFDSYDSQDQVLQVRVPDQATGEWCEEHYSELASAAIETLELPVRRIVYQVAKA